MTLAELIGYSVSMVIFSVLLFAVGRVMLAMPSVKKSLEKYQANPKNATWIEKYFFGFAFWGQLPIMKRLTQGWGNTFMTYWFKLMGTAFIVISIAFFFGIISLLVQWFRLLS